VAVCEVPVTLVARWDSLCLGFWLSRCAVCGGGCGDSHVHFGPTCTSGAAVIHGIRTFAPLDLATSAYTRTHSHIAYGTSLHLDPEFSLIMSPLALLHYLSPIINLHASFCLRISHHQISEPCHRFPTCLSRRLNTCVFLHVYYEI